MNPNQNSQNTQPQVYGSVPTQTDAPQGSQQTAGQGPIVSNGNNSSNNKKPLIIAVIVGVLLLIIVIVIAVVMAGSEGPIAVEEPNNEPQNPQPATTIGIEQINNAISQDLSSIDNTRDFPETQLSNDTLGL